MAARTYTREEMHSFAKALITEMNSADFMPRLKEAAARDPIPCNDEELIVRYEEEQMDFINTRYVPAADGTTTSSAAQKRTDGKEVLAQMRLAVKTYPDKETEKLISEMCVLEETQLMTLIASVPELAPLSNLGTSTQAGSHGHSHNGVPCDGSAHGHSHNHNHSHGGAHGHSHNGVPCDGSAHGHSHSGHGGMDAERMAMMNMAMQTLNPQQQATLQRVQNTVNSGSAPSADDMREMFGIQQHIMAVMQTMQQFSAPQNTGAGKKK